MRRLNRLLTWLTGANPRSAAEIWVTGDGRRIPIGDMSRKHLVHSLALVVRKANEGCVWVAASGHRPGGITFYTRTMLLLALMLLASCTQYIWPGDEVAAMRECVMHDSLARFESSSMYTTNDGWFPRFNYDLIILCRDGSTHRLTIKSRRL